MPRTNILIFCVDEMRADHLGCAGNRVVRTPNLDRLAADGTLFTRSYCNNPICMPARSTMFTGLLPRDHGVRINGQALRRDLPTLPGILAQAGYRTHAVGKLHLTPWVPQVEPPDPARCPECMSYWQRGELAKMPTPYYGFQTVDLVGGHTAYAYGDYIDWLRQHGGDPEDLQPHRGKPTRHGAPSCYTMALSPELHYNRFIADRTIAHMEAAAAASEPFFLWCSFPDPHCPVAPPEPYASMYRSSRVALPHRRKGEVAGLPPWYADVLSGKLKPNGVDSSGVTDAQWREIIAGTYGMISHIDAEIGRVLGALAVTGLDEDTVVVFLSDHGDMMGDHGLLWKAYYTFDGCIRIPTIVRSPGAIEGQVCDALVSQLDLMPSILDICGVGLPGSDWESRETPFERGSIQPLRNYPGHSWRGIVEGWQDTIRDHVVVENDDPTTGLRPRTLVTPEYRLTVYPGTPYGELCQLATDPHELENLWDRKPHLRQELVGQLLSAYAEDTPLYPIPPWNS